MAPVIVYTKPQCPNCERLKHALDANGIEYEPIDITQVEGAREEIIDRGFREMPVINDNDFWMSGFKPEVVNYIVQTHAQA